MFPIHVFQLWSSLPNTPALVNIILLYLCIIYVLLQIEINVQNYSSEHYNLQLGGEESGFTGHGQSNLYSISLFSLACLWTGVIGVMFLIGILVVVGGGGNSNLPRI